MRDANFSLTDCTICWLCKISALNSSTVSSFVQRLPLGRVDSALEATSTIPCKLRKLATKRSATMRGVDTGSGQLRLCRGSSQSACCMVSRTCFLRLMFTPHERSCLRVKRLDNHTQDQGRSQVHICSVSAMFSMRCELEPNKNQICHTNCT